MIVQHKKETRTLLFHQYPWYSDKGWKQIYFCYFLHEVQQHFPLYCPLAPLKIKKRKRKVKEKKKEKPQNENTFII